MRADGHENVRLEFKDGKVTRERLITMMRPLQREFEKILVRASEANIKGMSGSCKNMLTHKDAMWNFVTHKGVDPTNNHAERELRAFVLWRKRSFGTRSERGNQFAARLMTVVHTCRKQGKSVLDFLVATVRAHKLADVMPSLYAPAV